MSTSAGQPPEPAEPDPRLADLLDACLNAERAKPGSSAELIRSTPEPLRSQLAQLMAVADALQTAPWAVAPARLRAGLRLPEQARPGALARWPARRLTRRRLAGWAARAAAVLLVLALAGYGSVVGSSAALPGDALYGVKQADEFVTLALTRDDIGRALVLLQQASTRLDEAVRLTQGGQVRAAGQTLEQYVATLGRAAASLAAAQRSADPQKRAEFEAQLQQQIDRLQTLARDAPQPLRPNVEEAQVAANRELDRARTAVDSAAVSPSPAGSPTALPAVSPAASPAPRPPAAPSPSPSR